MPSFVARYSTDNHPKPEQAVSYFHLDPSNNRIIQAGTEHSSFTKNDILVLEINFSSTTILGAGKASSSLFYLLCEDNFGKY